MYQPVILKIQKKEGIKMIEHIYVEERCKTEDKDLIHVKFMTEEQLLASDIFGGTNVFCKGKI